MLERNNSSRLNFTTNSKYAINKSDILVIAVGTPSKEDGDSDLTQIYKLAKTIGQNLDSYILIIIKSTVPVGTTDKVESIILEELKKREVDIEFDIVFNPEFLQEGSSIKNFMKADRIIAGLKKHRA